MSFIGRGSWQRFRGAIERLRLQDYQSDSDATEEMAAGGLPAHQRARFAMQRLGHAEFYSSTAESDWRVVPPSLAISKTDKDWIAICCGARPPNFSQVISEQNFNVSIDSTQSEMAPESICVRADEFTDLENVALTLGLRVQVDASRALLAAVPPVDDPRSRFPSEAPSGAGWKIDRFLPAALQWTSTHGDRDLGIGDFYNCRTGLFRFRLKHQQFYFLRWNRRTYRTRVQVGKYAVMRRARTRNLLSLDRLTRELSVPITCRPPLFVERALILCTGRLPRIDTSVSRLVYESVPDDVARLAGALLRQEVNVR